MIRHGRGVAACASKTGTFYPRDATSAEIKMQVDGSVVVQVGAVDIGSGSLTAIAQIVAEELGISVEQVAVISGDTGAAGYDFGSVGSRVTLYVGMAAKRAAEELRGALATAAAALLECAPDDIVMGDGGAAVRGATDRQVPLREVVLRAERERNGPLSAHGSFSHGGAFDPVTLKGASIVSLTFVVVVADVDVDTETGRTEVTRLLFCTDPGRVINPMLVEGQIHGAAAMGIGYALAENTRPFADLPGEIVTTLFDYSVPTSLDVPPVESVILENPDPEGPFGARGVGEIVAIPVATAVCNAIYNAVGVRIHELPATPELVLRGLQANGEAPNSKGTTC